MLRHLKSKWRHKLNEVLPNNNLYLIVPQKWGKTQPLLPSFHNMHATVFCSGNQPVSRALAYQHCLSHDCFFTHSKFATVAKICWKICDLFWGQTAWAGLAVLSAYTWRCKFITCRHVSFGPLDYLLKTYGWICEQKRLKTAAHRKCTGFVSPETYAKCIQHHTHPNQPPVNCWGTIEVLHSTT